MAGKNKKDEQTEGEVIDNETVEETPEQSEIDNDFHEDEEILEEEYHEDAWGGMASKVLTAIVLLALGGAIALWAAPKIAPSLPSGMAPIANWLSSGQSRTDAELSALRSEIETRFNEMAVPVAADEIDAMILKSTSVMNADLSARIDVLAGQINETENATIATRLAELEAKFEGLRAELSSLTRQITDISTAGGEISAETSAQIATYSAELEGLRAEIAAMSAQNIALSEKIDEVSVSSIQQVQEAETVANEMARAAEDERQNSVIRANVSALGVALSDGTSFANILENLTQAGAPEAPEALRNASGGIVSMASLRADFPQAAHAAIRASNLKNANDGILSMLAAVIKSQIGGRSLTPQEGDSADAILSRAEDALRQDDLKAALAELANLPATSMPSEARGPMGDWIANASSRLEAIEAFEAYSLELESNN